MDQKTALSLFDYRDGALYWRVCLNSRAPIGSEAGTYSKANNRKTVRVYNKIYYTHRIIYLMHHGYLPAQIDHIDTNKHNNRIENLRAATPAQNQRNKAIPHNNTSGHKNISWKNGKWVVELKLDGKSKYFGRFDDLELASFVASEARDKYHGEFAHHG